MITPSFKTTAVTEGPDYGEFVLEPMDVGYGHTLGTALRRVLLTSLEGAAITSLKIDDVKHQFTTIPGIKEDVAEIILNVKQVRLAYTGDAPETLTLNASGATTVTAKDIEGPATVTIVNPDQHLATLTDKSAKLNLTLTVERGLGYSPAEDRPSSTVGLIPLDALFSPVTRVAANVESTRVGRRTDFDKLILKIWTDGTLTPRQALDTSAQILVDHFHQVYEPVLIEAAADTGVAAHPTGEVYNLTVEELELPTRIANALRKGGYKTVEHLTLAAAAELSKVKNLGGKSVDKVISALKKKGVSLKE